MSTSCCVNVSDGWGLIESNLRGWKILIKCDERATPSWKEENGLLRVIFNKRGECDLNEEFPDCPRKRTIRRILKLAEKHRDEASLFVTVKRKRGGICII